MPIRRRNRDRQPIAAVRCRAKRRQKRAQKQRRTLARFVHAASRSGPVESTEGDSFLHGPPPQARGTGAKAASATGERNGSGCAAARQDRASHSSDTGADRRVLILCRHAGTSASPSRVAEASALVVSPRIVLIGMPLEVSRPVPRGSCFVPWGSGMNRMPAGDDEGRSL